MNTKHKGIILIVDLIEPWPGENFEPQFIW